MTSRFAKGAALAGISLPLLPLTGLIGGWFGDTGGLGGGGDFQRSLTLLTTTILLALIVSAGAVAFGTLLGFADRRFEFRGRRWLCLACIIPLAIPSYVLAATLRHMLSSGGQLGQIFGITRFTGFWAAAFVLTLATTPYVQLLVSAALARIPPEEEAAARTLGASRGRIFATILWPRLRPSIAFSALLTQLYVISDFGAVAMLECPVLNYKLFLAVNTQRFAYAVQLGLLIIAASIPLLFVARVIQGRAEPQRGGVANPKLTPRRPPQTSTGIATYAIAALIIFFGAAIPVTTLGGWISDGIVRNEAFAPLLEPAWDTLRIALIGSVFTITVALAPAWVAARDRKWSGFVEQGTYLTSALPGVLLAFGLLLAALLSSRALGGGGLYAVLSQAGVLLIFGYGTRFLAEAFAGLKSAVIQLDPRQEETARTLGASRFRRWRDVILPPLLPGLAASFVLVTLAIMKELPVTLLLGGAMGLRTLSFRMFDRYQDAFLADAGLAGICLVVLAMLTLIVTKKLDRHV